MKRPKHIAIRKCFILFASTLLCVFADAVGLAQVNGPAAMNASSQRRVALVVGNNAYPQTRLENAVNDARAMDQTLGRLGFEVQKVEDTTLVDLAKAVDAFIGRLGAGDVGVFFYAGHGIQIEGENYLVPTDFEASDETVAKYKSYPAELVRERMEKTGARLNIIVLDACRNNPFKMSRSASRGLATMNSGRGTLIAFATGPGKTASDSSVGKNGLFTHHLIACLSIPGLSLDAVFNRARAEVDRASSHEQTPWVVSSVIGDFSFQPGSPAPSPKVELPPPTPSATVDYSDLEHLAAKRQQLAAYQREMKTAHDKARQLDESAELKPSEKMQLWQRFLDSFNAENSQDAECKSMREFASVRINYWKELPAPQPPPPSTFDREGSSAKTLAKSPPATNPISDNQKISDAAVKDFVKNYLSLVRSASIPKILDCYAEQVSFMDQGIVTRDKIRQGLDDYYRRWPQVQRSLSGDIRVEDGPGTGTKRATFSTVFSVFSPQRGAGVSGVTKNTLVLSVKDGALRIIDDKEQVLSRQRSN
jgi:uncharacterized caspase-like protein